MNKKIIVVARSAETCEYKYADIFEYMDYIDNAGDLLSNQVLFEFENTLMRNLKEFKFEFNIIVSEYIPDEIKEAKLNFDTLVSLGGR